MAVPGADGIYLIGCLERRITLYSQQVRALNLVYSLFAASPPRLRPRDNVVVIGGGAAGLTAAAGALHHGCNVWLVERTWKLLSDQNGCDTRWLHPHIYDWPRPDSTKACAGLPLLDWTATTASDVEEQIRTGWQRLRDENSWTDDRVQICCGSRVDRLECDENGLVVTWNPYVEPPTDIRAVFLAVGFGPEILRCNTHPYWRDDWIHQNLSRDGSRASVLVSGCGDGGLIDTLRLSLDNFRHERIFEEVIEPHMTETLRQELLQVDEDAKTAQRSGQDVSRALEDGYRRLYSQVPDGIRQAIRSRIRNDTTVKLNGRTAFPYSLEASRLNRFLVSLLRLDGRLAYISHPLNDCSRHPEDNKYRVTFSNGEADVFDHVVVRHGPEPEKHPLRSFSLTKKLSLAPVAEDDPTREPIWPEREFDLPEVRLPGMQRPVRPASEVPEIRFVDHSLVDKDTVAEVVGSSSTAIRWHAKIGRALDIVEEMNERLEERLDLSPSGRSGKGRMLFKASFQRGYQRLQRDLRGFEKGVARLRESTASATQDAQMAALRIYSTFAALYLIRRLRELGGRVVVSTSRGPGTVLDFFADFPEHGPHLFWLVPYYSTVGFYALDEGEFLRGRVGLHESMYEYIYLPRFLQHYHETGRPLPAHEHWKWVATQWLIHDFVRCPAAGASRVWVLEDEDGEECYMPFDKRPWLDKHQRVEPETGFRKAANVHVEDFGVHLRAAVLTVRPLGSVE